jgi:hypothetical protein
MFHCRFYSVRCETCTQSFCESRWAAPESAGIVAQLSEPGTGCHARHRSFTISCVLPMLTIRMPFVLNRPICHWDGGHQHGNKNYVPHNV